MAPEPPDVSTRSSASATRSSSFSGLVSGGAMEPRAKLSPPLREPGASTAAAAAAGAGARPADHAAPLSPSKNVQATTPAMEVIASAYNHGVLQYFGFLGVASASPASIAPTITALTDPLSDRYVHKSDRQDVVFSLAADELWVLRRPDDPLLRIRTMDLFCAAEGPSKSLLRNCFGVVCLSHPGDQLCSGFVCHVFQACSAEMLDEVLRSLMFAARDAAGSLSRTKSSTSSATTGSNYTDDLHQSSDSLSSTAPRTPSSSHASVAALSESSSAYAEPSPHGHRRVHSDGSLGLPGRPLSATHSPRGAVESRLVARARRAYERMLAMPPGGLAMPAAADLDAALLSASALATPTNSNSDSGPPSLTTSRRPSLRTSQADLPHMPPLSPTPEGAELDTTLTALSPTNAGATSANAEAGVGGPESSSAPDPVSTLLSASDAAPHNNAATPESEQRGLGSRSSSFIAPLRRFSVSHPADGPRTPRASLRADTACFRVCDMLAVLVASKDFSARENALSFLQQLHRAGILVGPAGPLEDSSEEYTFVFPGKHRCESQSSDMASVDSVTTEEEMLILADDVAAFEAALSRPGQQHDPTHLGDLLLRAVKLGGSAIVRCLLERGVDPNFHSDGVLPPLHSATVKGDRKAMLLLLEHGASTELRSPSGKTPLMLAASNRKLLECALILLEYGAQVHATDNDHVSSPATLQPELVEAQRHLCTAATTGLSAPAANLSALTYLTRLAGNMELRCELVDQLAGLPLASILGRLCDSHPTAPAVVRTLLLALFPQSSPATRAALEASVLAMLLDLLALPGLVLETALDIVHSAAMSPDRDCCSQLALLSLQPLLSLLLRTPEHHATATAILAKVTLLPKAQPALADEPHHQLLLSAFRAVAGAPNVADTTIEAILRVMCNACMCLTNQPTLCAAGLASLLRPFLSHPAVAVRFQACKCLVLLGEVDVGNLHLFDLCPLESVAGTPQDEEGQWARIKAAPIETVVGIMTAPVGSARTCQPLFLACEHYWHPTLLFRLIAHRYRCHAPATPLPAAHQQIFAVLRIWLNSSSGLFVSVPGLALELRTFLSALFALGGAYRATADDLGQLAVRIDRPTIQPYIGTYDDTPHEKLYQAMASRITSGRLPCSLDLAQTLAGLKIHIDDLERGGRPRARGDAAMPSTKLKAVLFPGAIKGRDPKVLLNRIAEEYAKVCTLSVRDAKHAYLETAAIATSYGCDEFYPVKEVVDKRRVARHVGVGKYFLVLLDDTTKTKVRREPHSALRRWEVQPVRGFDLLKAASAQLLLTFSTSSLALQADEPTLQHIASLLLERTTFLARLPPDERDHDDELDLDLFELEPAEETPMNSPRQSPATTPRASPPPSRRQSLGQSLSCSPLASPAHHATCAPASPTQPSAASSSHPFPGSPTTASLMPAHALPASPSARTGSGLVHTTRRPFECNCPPYPELGDTNLSALTLAMLLQHPAELARQLTLGTHILFLAVTGRQVIERVVHNRRAADSPVDQLIARFNKLSLWVATELLQIATVPARAAAIVGFIAAAKECVRLRNFNDAFCLVAGLDSAAIKRLSDTWDQLPDAAFRDYQELEALLSPDDNFRAYRAQAEGLCAPAVPYLGMFLRDLTLINIGNPDYVRGHANVFKWRQMLRQLKRIDELQQAPYNFLLVPEIQDYVARFVVLPDDRLFEMSKEFQGTLSKRASKSRLGLRRLSHSQSTPSG